jgi:ceramide glucosyltransferase
VTVTHFLGGLALLSLVLTLWQIVVAARFPLHQRSVRPADAAGLTILKPLKGCDAETSACLRSWLEQDYEGPVEIIFGVADPEDPVCAVARELIEMHPRCEARLLICGSRLGPNAKVSKLIEMERQARHEVICVSDADVWVPPDLLANLMAPLHDPEVGLVNCFYRIANPANFAMRWEAFAVNADFWSQVLQSASLKPMAFALGAVMAVPRRHLKAIGGFATLANYLADDYELGHRIAREGRRVMLCSVVVECRSAPMSFGEVWRHQVRWARTIRFCQPLPYFFSILSNGSLWPLLWVAVARSGGALWIAAVCLCARLLSGAWLERRLTGRFNAASLVMAPVKDLLQLGIWLLAFTGRQVVWRGERFHVGTGGKLARATGPA